MIWPSYILEMAGGGEDFKAESLTDKVLYHYHIYHFSQHRALKSEQLREEIQVESVHNVSPQIIRYARFQTFLVAIT